MFTTIRWVSVDGDQETKGRLLKQQGEVLRRLEEQQRQVTREMEDTLREVAGQMIEAVPDLLSEAIAALQAEDSPLMSRYDARRTPLHNFRDSAAVAIAVSQWLENRFPERFEKARKPFAEKLAAIDTRISELGEKSPQSAAAG